MPDLSPLGFCKKWIVVPGAKNNKGAPVAIAEAT